MVNSKTFDLTVKSFGDLVTEVFSGPDENQKAKLRTKLIQFSKISKSEGKSNSEGQISGIQAKKKRLSDVENILPPEMVEKIFKLLCFKDLCQAKLICRRWREIILKGNLVKRALGKIL